MHRLAAPAAILIFGVAMAGIAYWLGMGTITQPGPGFFPFWISTALALTALCVLIDCARNRTTEEAVTEQALSSPISASGRVAAAIAAIGFLAIALEYVGFFLASLFFLVLCWFAIDRQPVLRAVLISALCALASFLLFVKVLNVHFPRGLLGF